MYAVHGSIQIVVCSDAVVSDFSFVCLDIVVSDFFFNVKQLSHKSHWPEKERGRERGVGERELTDRFILGLS